MNYVKTSDDKKGLTSARAICLSLCLSASLLGLSACTPHQDKNSQQKVEMSEKKIEYIKAGQTDADHIYLEEVLGEAALNEVKSWNARSLARLESDPRFLEMQAQALEILNSQDKIPYVSYRDGKVHNFWQDAEHVRGIWRSSDLDSYLGETPKWRTVLDFDALAKTEDKNWVYKGNNCLGPDFTKCIVDLSDGGKDAVVRREFDTKSGALLSDGFSTPESKGHSDWLDKDHLLVAIDFGEGSMTESGYPRTARLWKRGEAIEQAVEIGSSLKTDIGYWPGTFELESGRREILMQRAVTFYDTEYFWVPRVPGDGSGWTLGEAVKFDVPLKSNLAGLFKDQMLLSLNEDWRGFKSGDLVSFSIDEFMKAGEIGEVHLILSPDEKSAIESFGVTKSRLLLSLYTDVTGTAYGFDWNGQKWTSQKLDFPAGGAVSIGATQSKEDIAFISTEGFLTPDTLWMLDSKTGDYQKAKSLPDWFDASTMISEQFFATSTDGTQVPYFVVRGKDIPMDGSNPTLLYAYGGFEISLNPTYSATRGRLWLERGGVYVLANIRGGGEYGPKWHQAGLKTNRQRIYDDFISVAEDLIDKKLTSPKHLGIEGGSNGGLLMGVMMTQRPDLFNAVICAVPLLDMMRFHTLLAGASWVGEYGNPEDESEGAFLRSISPYHNLIPDQDYPEVFFVTSTKDDRVHPAHARKMAKRMEDQDHNFLYYENIDGGHSAAANLKESARRLALQHTYLMQKLIDGK